LSSLSSPANSAINRSEPEFHGKCRRLTNPSTLEPAYDRQDEQFSSAFSILRSAINERAFPAASMAVTQGDRLVALKYFGRFQYEQGLEPTPSTPFDLASVTKVVATTAVAMILHERGLLDLDAPIAETVPEFLMDSANGDEDRRRKVSFRMLLAHTSGLPAYEKLFLKTSSRDELLKLAFSTPLAVDPGSRAEYSDVGFIILATALERIAEETLDKFSQREVFRPLAMTNTTFNPAMDRRPLIPPTADEREGPFSAMTPSTGTHSTFRNRIIQGEVQDENAFVLGGVAGHAGLFSNAEDVARFAHAMLQRGSPILRAETVELFTRRQTDPPGTSRALGWDTPSSPSQSGKYFGPKSFGHLGYTGTSLWIDPDRQLSVTLLTNRTWPDCSNQAIKQVRPKFHDAVVEALR
jgi:CubicO group peptidase (beta-lactamase class C family)